MGTALLASSPCFAPFSCLSPACWPSAGTWMTCTPGATSIGTSPALTRSLNDDFDEHADDMEDLEDLTPEEVEDREAILDDREGRLAGPIVRCGRWTNRVVELDGNTTAKFESTKITNRCTVLYKPTNCTGPIKLTCSKFLVDNRDPMHCKKGDSFITKPAAKNNTIEQPRIWYKREGPTENFPALSPYGNLKVWYKRSTGQLGTGRFPKKGVRCFVSC